MTVTVAPPDQRRWLALYVLCLGDLMIVLDQSIVNVALPSIQSDLGFAQSALAWVVNAYLLTFGGFLLLGGRLGDLFGHRRLFLAGIGPGLLLVGLFALYAMYRYRKEYARARAAFERSGARHAYLDEMEKG